MRVLIVALALFLPCFLEAENGLRWKNGEILQGNIRAATPAFITWESPLLAAPVTLRRDILKEILFGDSPAPGNAPYLVETNDGSRLFGKVTDLDESHLVLESPHFEPIRLLRSSLRRVRLMRSESLFWAGPYGKAGWKTEEGQDIRGLPQWTDEENGGGLIFLQMTKPALLDLDLPELFELSLTIDAQSSPRFAFSVSNGSHELRLETWDQTIVLRTGKTMFHRVSDLPENSRSITLRLFWDTKAQLGFVCSEEGEILTRFNEVDQLPEEIQSGIRVRGRCPELELRTLEIWKWDGSDPGKREKRDDFTLENGGPDAEPLGLPVELADTGFFSGQLIESDPMVASYRVGFSEDLFRIRNDHIRRVTLSPEKTQSKMSSNNARLHLGSDSISGQWIHSGSRELLWKLEGAKDPVAVQTDTENPVKLVLPRKPSTGEPECNTLAYLTSGEIAPGEFTSLDGDTESVQFRNPWFEKNRINQDNLQGVFFGSRRLSGDLRDPSWVNLGEGKAEAKDGKIIIPKDGSLGHPQILWGGKLSFEIPNATSSTPNLKLRLFCDGVDPGSRSTTLSIRHFRNNLYVAGMNNAQRAYVSRSFRTKGNNSQKVELTWTEELLKVRVGDDILEIPFDSVAGRSGFGLILEPVTRRVNTAVVVENLSSEGDGPISPVPYISPKALESVLIVPRSLGDQRPKHAIFGKNGDVLRGILEDFDGDRFLIQTGGLSSEIPASRVAGVVCLPVPPPTEQPTGGVWAVLRNGTRFHLQEPVFGEKLITGRSPVLGKCNIPTGQIVSLYTGTPPENPSADYLAEFQLQDAPEPWQKGEESLQKAGPAPEFSLPLLGGGDIGLFNIRGRIGVICFWTTWSAPSIRRVNELIELVEGLPERDVELIAINAGESVNIVQQTVNKQGWNEKLKVAMDGNLEMGKNYKATIYPTTAIIDRKGNLSRRLGISKVSREILLEEIGDTDTED